MTTVSRRNILIVAGLTSAAAAMPASAQRTAPFPASLPDKTNFNQDDVIYLDSGSQHPMSLGSRAAVDDYFNKRMQPGKLRTNRCRRQRRQREVRQADQRGRADEIAFVQSTTAGEQMVLRGLGLPQRGAHIVTCDTLHFFGSLPTLRGACAARLRCDAGCMTSDGRIPLEDMKHAIRKDTKLVALSLVSTINGFQHDLKAVCDIAHANGALVYADIIHAAGLRAGRCETKRRRFRGLRQLQMADGRFRA